MLPPLDPERGKKLFASTRCVACHAVNGIGGPDAPAIDAVLCSTATRTRSTLERTGIDAPVRFADRLYDATPGIVLDEINTVDETVQTLLVVGHEPVMSGLTLALADETSDTTALTQVRTKYPTSAMALLQLSGSWRELQLGGARLADFHVPR